MRSTSNTKPVRKPRPPTAGVPVLVRLQPAQLKAIDGWRRQQEALPTRAEAIRSLAADRISQGGRK